MTLEAGSALSESFVPSALTNPVPEFSLRYNLDWRDALAWEKLPAELSRRQRAIYIGFLVAGGMILGIMSDDLPIWLAKIPGIFQILLFVAIMQLLWMIYFNQLQRLRARRMIPKKIYCVFEDWGDHVYLHSEIEEASLSADLCRKLIVSPQYLFMDFVETPVIVPMAAFDSADQADLFVAKWQTLIAESDAGM